MARYRESRPEHRGRAAPPVSDTPPARPPTSVEEVVPPRLPGAGGLENIPKELVPAPERVDDEIDHAGLDVDLPDEDQTPTESPDEHPARPRKWGGQQA